MKIGTTWTNFEEKVVLHLQDDGTLRERLENERQRHRESERRRHGAG